MKFLLPTAFVLLTKILCCQYSISGGPFRHLDNLPENSLLQCFSKTQLQRYNGFTLQGDYQKTFFRTYVELANMASSFEVVENTNYSFFSNSGSFYDKRVYHSNVRFNALVFKYGIGVILKKDKKAKFWFNLSGNMFFQYDRLIREKEYNQIMYRKFGSGQPTQSGWQETSIDYPPDYTPYDLVQFKKNLFQFGIELKNRLGFKNYFAELSGSIGLMDRKRTQITYYQDPSNYSLNENFTWNFNTSLKLGYSFPPKKNLTPTTP